MQQSPCAQGPGWPPPVTSQPRSGTPPAREKARPGCSVHSSKQPGGRRGPKAPTSPPSTPDSPDGEGPTRPPSRSPTPSWTSPGTSSPTVLSMTTLVLDSSSSDTIQQLRRSGSSAGSKTSASRSASPQLLHSAFPTPVHGTDDTHLVLARSAVRRKRMHFTPARKASSVGRNVELARAEDVEPVLCAPVDDEDLTGAPHARTPATVVLLAPRAAAASLRCARWSSSP